MIKNIFLLISLSLFAATSFAGNENHTAGAKDAAKANASVTQQGVWAALHNQAGLAKVTGINGGLFYKQGYLMKELSVKSLVVASKIPGGVLSLNTTMFGYSAYNETKTGLAFARSFGKKVMAGIQFNYFLTNINDAEYGKKDMFGAELGVIYLPMENIEIGVHLFNPTNTKLSEYNNEKIPSILTLGGTYHFSEVALLSAEMEKDIDLKPRFKGGVEYRIVKQVYVAAGLASNPIEQAFGFGVILNPIHIDIAIVNKQLLGLSPMISLSYIPNPKKTTDVE